MRIRYAPIIAVLFLAMPGCLYHGGYYPNGYYGPGSVLPSQPGYQPGGPVYQPGGTPMYQPGTPMTQPGNPYPTPLNGNNPYVPGTSPGGTSPYTPSNPTYGDPTNGTGGNAPPFDSNPSKTVPTPTDDDFNRQPGAQRPVITPTSGSDAAEELSSPFEQQDTSRRPRKFENNQYADQDAFEAPVIQTSGAGGAGNEVRYANQQTQAPAGASKVYGNDRQFAWIQGVVEYDEASATWIVMYNDNPKASDPNGGELTLADDPILSRLRTRSVIRVYGELDDSELDARRKAVYRATKIETIAAKAP